MGYAYEDEENLKTEETKKESKSKRKRIKNKDDENKFIVDNLLVSSDEPTGDNLDPDYSVDNLLDSEEDTSIYLSDLLSKKDARLINAYLGKNAEKITGKKFNFAAFFFGGSYLIYRKVYGIGVFLQVLILTVQILFPIADIKWYVTDAFLIAASLVCGFYANQLILNNAASKMLNLKMNKDPLIKDKLIKMGGCNPLLCALTIILSSTILTYNYYNTGIELLEKLKYEETYIEYDGRINANENVNIRTLIDVNPPVGYKTSHAGPYQYAFSYTGDANIAIDIYVASRYNTVDSLMEGIAKIEGKTKDDVHEITLNNIKWSYLENDLSYYAVAMINNNMFFVRHMHRGNQEAAIDYTSFLESITPLNQIDSE